MVTHRVLGSPSLANVDADHKPLSSVWGDFIYERPMLPLSLRLDVDGSVEIQRCVRGKARDALSWIFRRDGSLLLPSFCDSRILTLQGCT